MTGPRKCFEMLYMNACLNLQVKFKKAHGKTTQPFVLFQPGVPKTVLVFAPTLSNVHLKEK